MNIERGQFYINKTWRFLLPCLRGHGESFVRKFNPVFKLAVGIHDTLLDGTDFAEGRNVYILCNTISQSKAFEDFLIWIREEDYYITDYCPDSDFQSSRKRMIVIRVPDRFNSAYDNFLKGKYSKMYDQEDINSLFSIPAREKEYKILTLDSTYAEEFVKQVNKEFSTTVTVEEFESFEEMEIPLKRCEEVFNCYENDRLFFSEDVDKNIKTI